MLNTSETLQYKYPNSSEKGERSSTEVNAPRHRSITFPQLEQAPKEFTIYKNGSQKIEKGG